MKIFFPQQMVEPTDLESSSVVHCRPQSPTVVHCRHLSPTVVLFRPLSSTVVHSRSQSPTVVHSRPLLSNVVHCRPLLPTVTHCIAKSDSTLWQDNNNISVIVCVARISADYFKLVRSLKQFKLSFLKQFC